jgi:hypothetical protein
LDDVNPRLRYATNVTITTNCDWIATRCTAILQCRRTPRGCAATLETALVARGLQSTRQRPNWWLSGGIPVSAPSGTNTAAAQRRKERERIA